MRALAIAAGVIAVIVIGLFVLRGPSPVIAVAPEHIFDIGPLAVTNTMFTSWIVVILMSLIAFFAGRRMSLVPSGFSGVVEAVIAGFYGIVENAVGEKQARKFFWVVATIFFYILVSNYVGLVPPNFNVGVPEAGHGEKQAVFEQTSIAGIDIAYIPLNPQERDLGAGDEELVAEAAGERFSGTLAPMLRSVNTDVNAPLAIAIFAFVFIEFWGLQALGFGYLGKFFSFGRVLRGSPAGLLDVFVGLLEFISELIRVVSFTFRLFGNIFAGEVLLIMMSFLVPLLLVDVFYGLELFVGLIQAFVFAMLTLVFAQQAVTAHGDGHEAEASAAHE